MKYIYKLLGWYQCTTVQSDIPVSQYLVNKGIKEGNGQRRVGNRIINQNY